MVKRRCTKSRSVCTITIDTSLLQKARRNGINISQASAKGLQSALSKKAYAENKRQYDGPILKPAKIKLLEA